MIPSKAKFEFQRRNITLTSPYQKSTAVSIHLEQSSARKGSTHKSQVLLKKWEGTWTKSGDIKRSNDLRTFLLTFRPEFHMYTCMHAFAKCIASHHTVKVHEVTAKNCSPIDQHQASEKNRPVYWRTGAKVSTDCSKGLEPDGWSQELRERKPWGQLITED